MKFRPLATLALAITLPFAAVACSEDSTGNYSESEIAEELVKAGWTQEQAECLAPTVKDLNITESETRDPDALLETDKGKAFQAAIVECLGSTGPTMLDDGA